MPYRYAIEREDYSDFSSGRVFHSSPGQTAFPVRLGSELFQRCLALRATKEVNELFTVFDPCCGGAYHLSTLAFYHWDRIGKIIASDINERALDLARRNLSLLTVEGMERRINEIKVLHEMYGKDSHSAALESACRLKDQLMNNLRSHPVETTLFQADVGDQERISTIIGDQTVDLVFTDIPYGWHHKWIVPTQTQTLEITPVRRMFETLSRLCHSDSIVIVAADKGQKINHPFFERIEQFKIGKRHIVFLQPKVNEE